MSRIREKATESEAVVRNITKDIQILDLAKKNLILSMTMLRRLQMLGPRLFPCVGTGYLTFSLVNAMTQLEDYIKEKRYKEVSESLSVCVMSLFPLKSEWLSTGDRLSKKYPLGLNNIHPFNEYHASGNASKKFKGNYAHSSTLTLTHCMFSVPPKTNRS